MASLEVPHGEILFCTARERLIQVKKHFTFHRSIGPVHNKAIAGSLRIISYAVIAAMAAALIYAAYISLANWAGIAV
jgi:hypothetical protein